ncbi:MAG: iron ABC transporter permease [Roseiflexaceae bacterium]|nr:iron ABC transporter permease [Roseiflexaceae bacterium]
MIRRSPPLLFTAALAVCLLAAVPLCYIAIRALGAEPAVWSRLWTGQIPPLVANTITLLLSTMAAATVIGVAAAWLVECTDLPGRATVRWLLALPLSVPAYVAAICWIILLRPNGLVEQAAIAVFGLARGALPLPPVYSLWGATFVISLCVFPYVYLTSAAALRAVDRSFEEAARVGGRGRWAVFRTITLPLIAPAVGAGALLVGMYVLSDFGTVAMLRYRTFTTAIYNQFAGQIDRSAAAILSFVLIALTMPLLFGESLLNRRSRRVVRDSAWRPRRLVALGRWRWLALAGIALLLGLSLGVPLLVLGGLSLQGLLFPSEVDRIWGINNDGLLRFGGNSLLLAVLSATLATVLAFAPAYLVTRFPHKASILIASLGKTAFALPGLIVGLGFVLLFSQAAPLLYGTLAGLALGFAFRLLPQAITANEAALRRAPASLEQAARTLGQSGPGAFRRVTLPIAAPGILVSWTLVFVTAMKELPTVMLLRPPGFDTLPVRIWAAASESVHTQAAPPAFALIVLTMLPLALVYTHGRFGLDRAIDA